MKNIQEVPGFRSLCIIPLACRQSMARAMSSAKFKATWRSKTFGRILIKYLRRDIPGNNSVTIAISGSLQAPKNCQGKQIPYSQVRTTYKKHIPSMNKSHQMQVSNYHHLDKILMFHSRHHVNLTSKTTLKGSSFLHGTPTVKNFNSNNPITIPGKNVRLTPT